MSQAFGPCFGPVAGRPSLLSDEAIIGLVGAVLLEQNDAWTVQRARSMTLDSIAPAGDDPVFCLPAVAT